MAFTLSRGNYSMAEKKLFLLLRRTEVDTKALVAEFYKDQRATPDNALIIVGATMRSLIKKTAENGESFLIIQTARCGPYPIKYRLRRK